MSEKNVKVASKSRAWTCLVYADSAPADWQDKCQQLFLETYIILHDKDVNPDGTTKKPHYHVVMCWSGPTTFENAEKLMASFGGVIEHRPVGSVRGICRYLCHMDNPEKTPYDPKDVIQYNGADYNTVISLASDKYNSIAEMQDFCDKYSIVSYKILSDYARRNRKDDWFRALCDNASYTMSQYIKSLKWQIENDVSYTVADLEEQISAEEKVKEQNDD